MKNQMPGLSTSAPSTATAAVSPTSASAAQSIAALTSTGPKRLHVSNIPFRFREADLRQLLGVSIHVLLFFTSMLILFLLKQHCNVIP